MAKRKQTKNVETLTHDEASRKNLPTAEYQSVMEKADQSHVQVAYGDATAISTRSSYGVARTSRTGPTSWSRPHRCSSRRRSTRKC